MSQNAWNAEYNDAKGALLVGNGTRPVVRTVGTDGFVLTANSAQADGVEWLAPGAGIVNLSPYIVGATQSDFTTISAAIAQAVLDGASSANPFNIYVKPGTYTENITLSDGINIVGFGGRESLWTSVTIAVPDASGTRIVGNVSVTGGYTSLCNVNIVPTAGNAIDIAQTGLSLLMLDRVNVVAANNTAVFNLSSTLLSNFIQCNDCTFQASGATGRITNNVGVSNIAFFSFINCILVSNNNTPSLIDNGSRTDYFCESCYIRDALLANNCIAGVTIRNSVWQPGVAYAIDSGTNIGSLIAESTFITGGLVNSTNVNSQIQFRSCTSGTNVDYSLPNTGSASVNLTGWVASEGLLIRNGIGYNGSEFRSNTAKIQTTNATPANLFTLTINTNETVTLRAQVTAADSTHANAVGGTLTVVVNRAGGGSAIVGAVTTDVKTTSAATFTAVLVGNNVAVQVTGVLGQTYNWTCYVEYQKMLSDA